MNSFIIYAYILALSLWLPLLLYLEQAKPQLQVEKILKIIIRISAIAAIYEAIMRVIFSDAIRIDIFLILPLLGIFDAAAGGLLFYIAVFRNTHATSRIGISVIGAVCISVPVLSLYGANGIIMHNKLHDQRYNSQHKYRFEASFRSDETERRIYGRLNSPAMHMAGYYIGDNQDDRYKHLVINDKGEFWIFNGNLWQLGKGTTSSTPDRDQYHGSAISSHGINMNVTLKHVIGNTYELVSERTNGSNFTETSRQLQFTKVAPPRFPTVSTPNDQVKYLGEFSAKIPTRYNTYWVTQMWLWEAQGKVWGEYLHAPYDKGHQHNYISSSKIETVCNGDCGNTQLSFKVDGGDITITKSDDGHLLATFPGSSDITVLKRGEVIPGFILDLAPLATMQQNQEWIESVKTGNPVEWKAE